MVNLFKKLFTTSKPAIQEPPQNETPAYYDNLFTMLVSLKRMLDSKHLTYPFSGINNPLFDKSDFSALTPAEQQEAERLIDDLITEILFFQVVDPDSMDTDKLADMAGTELVLMSARMVQDMPVHGNITIH